MKVVLESGTEDTQTDWVENQTREPEDMQAILRFPSTVDPAARKSEREAVIQVVAVELDENDADPVTKGKCGVLLQGETIATFGDGLLEPDGGERIDTDVEAEGNEGEDAHDNSDRADSNEDRGDPNLGLLAD